MSASLGDSQVQVRFLTGASEFPSFRKDPHFKPIVPITALDILPSSPDLPHGPHKAACGNFILSCSVVVLTGKNRVIGEKDQA